jgi:hypothetical protein
VCASTDERLGLDWRVGLAAFGIFIVVVKGEERKFKKKPPA